MAASLIGELSQSESDLYDDSASSLMPKLPKMVRVPSLPNLLMVAPRAT
jgi:hypothetical protein